MANPSDAGASYISSRPVPPHLAAQGEDKDHAAVVHRMQLGTDASSAPTASALRFPRPENIWLSRDVDRADWTAFAKELLPRRATGVAPTTSTATTATTNGSEDGHQAVAADETTRREHLTAVLEQWNKGFFEPRGLAIVAQFGDKEVGAPASTTAAEGDESNTSASTAQSKQPSRGFGLKLGNSLLGVSLPPHSHGYGLRLGGVLLGVRVDDDDEGEGKGK
jgi:hypothetical protein